MYYKHDKLKTRVILHHTSDRNIVVFLIECITKIVGTLNYISDKFTYKLSHIYLISQK